MTDNTDISNLAFTKIQDTFYDSKLMEGLAKLGVLPHTFQAIQAVLDVADVTADGDGVAADGTIAVGEAGRFIDVQSGQPVVLSEGQQIVLLQAVATTALTADATSSLTIGLAAAGTSDALSQALTSVATYNAFNSAGSALANPGNIVGSNLYLKGASTLGAAALTAGVVQVLLIVV